MNDEKILSIPGLFDEEEIIENCTVQILRNSVTGECSVGWWRGSKDEMLKKEENCSEKV